MHVCLTSVSRQRTIQFSRTENPALLLNERQDASPKRVSVQQIAVSHNNELGSGSCERHVQTTRIRRKPYRLGTDRRQHNDVLLISLESVDRGELEGRFAHPPMERRALCRIQRNDTEGDGWGDALKEAKDDLQFALIDERVCISQNNALSTIAGLFGRGMVDKQQPRERRQDEQDGLCGGSVEERGVVEESGRHVGDERVATILCVQQKRGVYSSRGIRVETKGKETLKEGDAHRRDSFYP